MNLLRRGVARALVLVLSATLASGASSAAPAAQAPAPAEDALEQLLASRDLARTTNPVAANFLFGEGAGRLPADAERRARDQLMRALHAQTDTVKMMMQGAAGSMNTESAQQMMEWSKKQSATKSIIEQQFGMAPTPPPVDPNRMQQETKQAMIDPWVRGLESARALERGGDARSAAYFYMNCLQMLDAKWVPDSCLEGILGLGPARAETILSWMLENADSLSVTDMSGFGPPGMTPPKKKDTPPDRGMVQLRNAALEGLGALAGEGDLAPDVREKVMSKLLFYANGKENEPFYQGAAEGLGRAKDPRGLEPLRRLSHAHGAPDVRLAAWRGLAVGFHDGAAMKEVRAALDDKDTDEQLRASQALYEAGDDAAFKWAVEMITHRRTSDAKKADIRSQVVRDLVELGGPKARQALSQALAEGAGNDWLNAWVAVGLLELGDTSQMPRVEQALAKTDWSLDPRGFRSIWRAIRPFLNLAAAMLLTGGLAAAMAPSTMQQARKILQVVQNFAAGERGRYLAKVGQREAVTAQLRWQAAEAIAAAHPPGAAKILIGMLDDVALPVRASAAEALARLEDPAAATGIARAYALDFGQENGEPRTPAVRAALLRAALLRFPAAPETKQLVAAARQDSDAGLRLIGLAAKTTG